MEAKWSESLLTEARLKADLLAYNTKLVVNERQRNDTSQKLQGLTEQNIKLKQAVDLLRIQNKMLEQGKTEIEAEMRKSWQNLTKSCQKIQRLEQKLSSERVGVAMERAMVSENATKSMFLAVQRLVCEREALQSGITNLSSIIMATTATPTTTTATATANTPKTTATTKEQFLRQHKLPLSATTPLAGSSSPPPPPPPPPMGTSSIEVTESIMKKVDSSKKKKGKEEDRLELLSETTDMKKLQTVKKEAKKRSTQPLAPPPAVGGGETTKKTNKKEEIDTSFRGNK
eukprot:jgi/Bigna1/74410/fgenesh1_pg.29_\